MIGFRGLWIFLGEMMGLNDRILEKSNSYKFYKENYEKLKDENHQLKESNKRLADKNNDLNKQYDLINEKFLEFQDKCESDFPFFNSDGLLNRSYISPVIKYPFNFEHSWYFSFSDHLTKYLREKSSVDSLVSIICPVYNYEENILNLINSVLNQTYTNFELLLIDNCSEDNTLDLIKSIDDSRIRIFENHEKKNFAYCRNLALKNSNGEYVFYIDMDNLWDSEYLSTMVGLFSFLPDADAVYSGQIIYSNNFQKISGTIFGAYNKRLLYNNNFISLSAFAHKLKSDDELLFDESLDLYEDWLFLLNVAKDFKLYSTPFFLSKFSSDKYFHDKLGFNHDLDSETINKIHKKVDYSIFNDFSKCYKLNKKISVIIPSYNLIDDLKECINAILSFDSDFIDIIVVDNDSEENVREFLKKMESEGKIKYIQNNINYGFTYAIEQGIAISDDNSDILLLNNDAILSKGALEAMQYYAYSLQDCGIIVPCETLYPNDIRMSYNVPFVNPEFECDVSTSKIHKNIYNVPLFFDGNILELDFAPFFCTYIKRDVYDKTLGLDPELGRHYRSDRIFCDFIRLFLNLKIYHIADAKVYHKSQQSTKKLEKKKDEYEMIFLRNQWEPDLAKKLGYKTYSWDIING